MLALAWVALVAVAFVAALLVVNRLVRERPAERIVPGDGEREALDDTWVL